MVSNLAIYVVSQIDGPIRRSYEDIAMIRGGGVVLGWNLLTGTVLRVDFGRANRNLIRPLQEQCDRIAR